ncbi:MAG: hypothetical protein JWM91_4904 [Rhodospirillales bacterium]|nr:hypothetical protein [Rhodospirillales bacterium]
MTRTCKQKWEIGQVVSVGFISGLEVIGKVATPGDYKPDLWVLVQASTKRIYRFVPHSGLSRVNSFAEAVAW